MGFALMTAGLPAQVGPVPAATTGVFVQADSFDYAAILPAPPAPDTLAGQADLETVQRAQLMRTAEDVAWAKLSDASMHTFMETAVAGEWFTEKNLPYTAEFLNDVMNDGNAAIRQTKSLFARHRPPLLDKSIEPCVPLAKSFSYPSGHATRAYVWAGVMGDLFPERRAEFEAYASKVAWGRIIAGVHFPTDLAGGRRVADALLKAFRESVKYQAAIKKARREAGPFLTVNK